MLKNSVERHSLHDASGYLMNVVIYAVTMQKICPKYFVEPSGSFARSYGISLEERRKRFAEKNEDL